VDIFGLGEGARARLAIVLADVFGESADVANDVAKFMDGYLRDAPALAAFGLRAAIWAILWLPILFVGRPLPVDALAPATRAKYLLRWSDSHLYLVREAFYLVKAIALFGWGAHPIVRARFAMPLITLSGRRT
jgi:hypothetical protein